MKLIYLKSALKCDSFDAAIDIKIPFFRVLVPIEPDRSLLQFVTTNCLITEQWFWHNVAKSHRVIILFRSNILVSYVMMQSPLIFCIN